MIPIDLIRRAAAYLLRLLQAEAVIRSSRFFNEDPTSLQQLVEGMQMTEEEADLYRAHSVLGQTIEYLREQGYVYELYLDEQLLSDFTPDFHLMLSQPGREAIADGTVFRFLDYL